MKSSLSCSQQLFSILPNGETVTQFQLVNSNGVSARIIDYGATLTSLRLPVLTNPEIVLGFDTLEDYLKHEFYFGCTIGRVANRIAHGRFNYQGKAYQLICNNNNRHHIHGGAKGFDKVIWRGEMFKEEHAVGVKFSYLSKDGEEGYPGNLEVTCTYILTDNNELKILFWAKTDQATPVDLTNHTYWNLAGEGKILDHQLQVFADKYIVTDQEHIPSGEICPVHNTPFDFTELKTIGEQMTEPGKYDVFYIARETGKSVETRLIASLQSPNKRSISVYTTQPGLQFYTGNYLYDYTIADNKQITQHSGFCLETQGFPDAVNHANFHSPFLLPGEIYQHETVYKLNF